MIKWFLILILFTSCASINSIDNMPFGNKGLVIINIPINGKNERFLVDTGSSSSYISTEFLRDKRCFNLNEKTSSYASATTVVEFKTTKVKVVIYGETYIMNTISLYALNKSIDFPVVGILGSDFIRRNKLIIDYNKKMIYQSKD